MKIKVIDISEVAEVVCRKYGEVDELVALVYNDKLVLPHSVLSNSVFEAAHSVLDECSTMDVDISYFISDDLEIE